MVSRVLWALDNEIEPRSFERLCVDLLSLEGYSKIIPVGGVHDRGRDSELIDVSTGLTMFFQYSLEERWLGKLRKELKKVQQNGHKIDRYLFITSQTVTGRKRDSLSSEVKRQYGWELIIFDREWLRNRLEIQHPQLAGKYLGIVDTTSDFGKQQIELLTDLILPSVMENANALFEKKDYKGAVVEYQHYIRLHPDNPEASNLWYMIGYCQYHLGRYDDALESLTTAAKLGGESVIFLVAKASILAESGMTENDRTKLLMARKMFSELANGSEDWLHHYNYANVLSALGEHNNARNAYIHAANFEPNEATIWNNLGNLYIVMGDVDKAISYFDQALGLDSDLPEALASKGTALLQFTDKLTEAAELIDMALHTRLGAIKWKQGWFWLALAHFELGDTIYALQHVNKGLETLPSHPGLLNLKAEIYSKLWRDSDTHVDEAIKFYEFLSDLGTATFNTEIELAQLYLFRGHIEKAAGLLEQKYDLPSPTLHSVLESFIGRRDSPLKWHLDIVNATLRHYSIYKHFRSSTPVPRSASFLTINNLNIPQEIVDDIYIKCLITFGYAYENLSIPQSNEDRLVTLGRLQHEIAIGLDLLVDNTYQLLLNQYPELNPEDKKSLQLFVATFAATEWIGQLGWISGRLRLPQKQSIEILNSDDSAVNRFLDRMLDLLDKNKG